MRKKSYLSLALSAALVISLTVPAYGALGPGDTGNEIPEGVTQEQWDRLNDQTIEFDELSNLVKYFNPDYLNVADSAGNELSNQQYTYDEIRQYIKELNGKAKDLKEDGATSTADGAVEYATLLGTASAMETGAQTLKWAIMRIESAVDKGTSQALKNYSYGASQLMIGYNTALANQALLEKVLEVNNAVYETQKLSYEQGMATEADVLSANKGVLSAQASLLQLNNSVDSLKRSLSLMTGYSVDAQPQIGAIPELDLNAISSLNLEEDTAKAIGNNYDLIELRHTASDQSTTGMKSKANQESESEQTITITMQTYYHGMKQAQSAYEAASTAYEKATLEKGKADRSYGLGMLSKINYLQTQMAFLQAESEKQSAYNTLYQAYETYQWAVKGIITTSE